MRERGRERDGGREAADDVDTMADMDTTGVPTRLNVSPCQRLG